MKTMMAMLATGMLIVTLPLAAEARPKSLGMLTADGQWIAVSRTTKPAQASRTAKANAKKAAAKRAEKPARPAPFHRGLMP